MRSLDSSTVPPNPVTVRVSASETRTAAGFVG